MATIDFSTFSPGRMWDDENGTDAVAISPMSFRPRFTSAQTIRMGLGTLAGLTHGTYAAVIRLSSAGFHSIFTVNDSSGGNVISLESYPTTTIFLIDGNEPGGDNGAVPTDGWCLLVASKATGSAPVSFWKYVIGTSTWTTDASDAAVNATRTPDYVEFGAWQSSNDYFDGDIEAAGIWKHTVLTEDQVHALAENYANWASADFFVILDELPLVDRNGGATQTSTSGTTTTSTTSSGIPLTTYVPPVGYTEVEWSIGVQAPAADDDVYEFRVYDGSTPLTYAVTPQLTVAPAVEDPVGLDGCQLWLDASDSSTLTLTGTDVDEWGDKSGNDHHAVDVDNTDPQLTGTINGLDAVAFHERLPADVMFVGPQAVHVRRRRAGDGRG